MKTVRIIILGCLLPALMVSGIRAAEFSGVIGMEYSHYINTPLHADQERHDGSIYFQPEFYHRWNNGSALTVVPFARIDSADEERNHFDIRELNYLWVGNHCEMLIGAAKVFWGVTEFVHLVDIINQTDLIEDIDGESKLGQPMARFTWLSDRGNVHIFVLPLFRERTFPGKAGRLRTALAVDTQRADYESDDEERHVDTAIRYSHYIGNFDLGLYHFRGTGREPLLQPSVDSEGRPILIPYYRQIHQTGLDLQWVYGQWLFKTEAIYLSSTLEDYYAAVGGFEYTWVGIADTHLDLGLVMEYSYDDRGENASNAYANDIIGGLRLAFNNPAGTDILIGMAYDLDNGSKNIRLEAGHRLNDHWKLELESVFFLDPSEGDILYDFRHDDYVRLTLNYHY